MTTWWRNYSLLAICWGLPFYFIMVALHSFAPVQIAFGRLLIGAFVLWLVLVITRTSLPTNKIVYGHLFIQAMLLNSIPGVLFASAEQHVSSIMAGIFNGMTPLFALLATLTLFREQAPTAAQKLGLALGFVGVLIVLGVWQGIGESSWQGFTLLLIAISGYGISFPYSRRYIIPHGVAPTAMAAIQVSFGAIQLVPFMLITPLPTSVSRDSALGILALGLISTGLAYILHFRLLQTAGAIISSTVAYWTPLVAGIAGTVLLSESLSWQEPVGAVVIVFGLLIAQERLKLSRG
ncbi:MAG: hypothetical protein RL410_727 [Actinomycetota bacterium]|jgi:drug/metabolite transporter (DMT)-like permease